MLLEEIKNDQSLRIYFFDLISKNFMLGLASIHPLKSSDSNKVHKDYYDAYQNLINALKPKVNDEDIYSIIQQVSLHYIGTIGRIKFIGRDQANPSNN